MASRGFFAYDPYDGYVYDYDHYTAAPYNYPYDVYLQRQPASARSRSSKSKGAVPAKPPSNSRRARDDGTKTSFSIPVHGPDSDPEPERKPKPAAAARKRNKERRPAMPAEQAAVRMQAAARGFLARKSVRAVRQVEREAEGVLATMMAEEEEALVDPRARVAVGEALMRMLLRLDAVHGARVYRRRITKRVLALQDAVDELETTHAAEEAEAEDDDAPDAAAAVEDESAAEELPCPPTSCLEVDGATAAAAEPEAGEDEEKEAVPADADADEAVGSEADGEWEMVVTDENEHITAPPVAATSDDDGHQEPPRKEPADTLEITASTGATSDDGVDAKKVMQMVAALCEQSAQQCAVIGKLAERVDALERAVRRMDDAETRRRLDTENN